MKWVISHVAQIWTLEFFSTWPPATIWDLIQPEVVPFDPPAPGYACHLPTMTMCHGQFFKGVLYLRFNSKVPIKHWLQKCEFLFTDCSINITVCHLIFTICYTILPHLYMHNNRQPSVAKSLCFIHIYTVVTHLLLFATQHRYSHLMLWTCQLSSRCLTQQLLPWDSTPRGQKPGCKTLVLDHQHIRWTLPTSESSLSTVSATLAVT